MKSKTLMLVSFTEQGSCLNDGLNGQLSALGYVCESYAVKRFADKHRLQPIPSDTKQWIGSLWGCADFVFIGAIGIAVRYIAPWIEDKYKDSAVISLDEAGQFVIPVLSGHVGGGVELANKIAACIGAVPVITTATDVQKRFAVDVFARKNQLHITSRELAKRISAAVLEGKKTGFYSAYPVCGKLPSDLELREMIQELNRFEYGIAVKEPGKGKKADLLSDRNGRGQILYLHPRNLVVGIGCRKGVSYERIRDAIQSVFQENGWKMEQIGALTSIDLKREEAGILELAKVCGIPFYTYSAEQLREVETVSSESAFVQSVTGVDNVCERAAKRCCPDGNLVLPKIKLEQITLAVVRRSVEIEF